MRVDQTLTYPTGGTGGAESFQSTIHATIQSEKGWDVLMEEIREQSNEKTSFEISHSEQGPLRAEVVLYEDLPLSGEWLKDLVGRDAIVTILTPDGSRFSINGNHIGGYEFEESYNLGYTLLPYKDVSDAHRNVVSSAVCYWLYFKSDIAFPVTVEVFLDPYAATQYATLYECVPDNSLVKLNSAMIDREGYVGFPVQVINKSTRYLLAMNVATVHRDEVWVPDSMVGEDNPVKDVVPLSERYAMSEPRGLMGMTMKEFTNMIITIVGVFLGVVLVIVLTLIIIGKRRAKMARIRAEVMGTDALEEYGTEEPSKKRKKFSFKKASADEKKEDDENREVTDADDSDKKRKKFSLKKAKKEATEEDVTSAEEK